MSEERIKELETSLADCICQIEYLHVKFPGTGTSESVLLRAKGVLQSRERTRGDGSTGKESNELPSLKSLVNLVLDRRGWAKTWQERSGYLHSEVAELTEAIRGKRGDVLEEAGDVLVTLIALSQQELPEIEKTARGKCNELLAEEEKK
jgi:NTP pyrophosphatase (non-canonical NTP hydrolase)